LRIDRFWLGYNLRLAAFSQTLPAFRSIANAVLRLIESGEDRLHASELAVTGRHVQLCVDVRQGSLCATIRNKLHGKLKPLSQIRATVEQGASIYTDALKSYLGRSDAYDHQTIDHAIEFVNGRAHTNNVENFWSLLKRTLKGTYVSFDPAHLDAYLDEQAFRFNEREHNDGIRK
jgi:hypothetical protein